MKIGSSNQRHECYELKWVYITKLKSNSSHERLKARLIAKGFNQVPEVDFLEIFSTIVKSAVIRII